MSLSVVNGPPPKLIQSRYARLTVNVTTVAILPVFTTILTVTITTRPGSFLVVHAETALNVFAFGANRAVSQAIHIDGTRIQSWTSNVTGAIETGMMSLEEPVPPAAPLAAGLHTVLLTFAKFSGTGVVQILAATSPAFFSANLLVQEISS